MPEPIPNLRIHPEALARRLGPEMVVVHLGSNRIFELNETAARWWELCAEGLSADEARAALLAEYDVAPAQLDQEIRTLTAALAAEGLLVRAPAK